MAPLSFTSQLYDMIKSAEASETRPSTPCQGLNMCSKGPKSPPLITPGVASLLLPISSKTSEGCGSHPCPRDAKMLWAATCLCFFGFLCSGEIVCPTETVFDPQSYLAFADVAVDNRSTPSAIWVCIKASKTDPFHQGVLLHIGVASGVLCPVTVVLVYMVARGSDPGPLFTWRDGRFLTRDRFVASVHAALTSAGYKAADYADHSF